MRESSCYMNFFYFLVKFDFIFGAFPLHVGIHRSSCASRVTIASSTLPQHVQAINALGTPPINRGREALGNTCSTFSTPFHSEYRILFLFLSLTMAVFPACRNVANRIASLHCLCKQPLLFTRRVPRESINVLYKASPPTA